MKRKMDSQAPLLREIQLARYERLESINKNSSKKKMLVLVE